MKSLAPLLAVIVLAFGGYKVYGMINEIKALKVEVEDLKREVREVTAEKNTLQGEVDRLTQELEEAKRNSMGMGALGAQQQRSAVPAGMREITCGNCGGRGLVTFSGMDGRTKQGPCPVCGGAGKKMLRIPEGNVVCPTCGGMQFLPKESGSSGTRSSGGGGNSGGGGFSRTSGVGSRELCSFCSGRGFIKGTPGGDENDPYGGQGMGGGMGGGYR